MRHRAVAAITLGLAFAGAAIACSSFGSSSGGTDVPDGAIADATGDVPAPEVDSGDAGSLRFCERHPSATICEDFDRITDIDPRWTVGGSGGTSSLSTNAFSPPRSLLLVSPVPASGADRCSKDLAYLRQDVNKTSSSFGFGASYNVDYASGQATVAGVQLRVEQPNNDRCTFYMKWTAGVPKVGIDQVLDGIPNNAVASLPLKATPVAPKTWVRIDLHFEVTAAGTAVTAGVDGEALGSVGNFPTCLGKEVALLQVQTNCNDVDAGQPFSTLIDDVTLDVQ